MNPPRRWLDDPTRAPDGALELLREARPSEGPSHEALARIADRVAAPSPGSTSWTHALGWKSIGALVGVASLAAALWRPLAPVHTAPSRVARVVATEPTRPPPRPPSEPRVGAPAPRPLAAEQVEAQPPARPSAPARIATPPPRRVEATQVRPEVLPSQPPHEQTTVPGGPITPAATSDESLSREAAWLERVRAQLATSPDAVIEQLRQHPTLFPRGQLTEEAGYLQFEALRRAGRTDEARRFAAGWITAHPRGLYTDRMRRAAGLDVDSSPRF
jgi:hypothetical protein